jgi:cell pole-organizing protein PopZ
MFIEQAAGTEERQRRQLMPSEVNYALAQTVLLENARTLQDLVREMLRPMLKSWLDDNLPTVVERLVLAEIERIIDSKPYTERRGH